MNDIYKIINEIINEVKDLRFSEDDIYHSARIDVERQRREIEVKNDLIDEIIDILYYYRDKV